MILNLITAAKTLLQNKATVTLQVLGHKLEYVFWGASIQLTTLSVMTVLIFSLLMLLSRGE